MTFSDRRIDSVQPLLSLMKDIGEANGGKSQAQVTINCLSGPFLLSIPAP
jgi:hypothetical protein